MTASGSMLLAIDERHGRHRLGDGSNGHADSKPGHAMTPTNWIPVKEPDTVISGRSLASVKSHHPDKTPIHEKPGKAFITIKLAVECAPDRIRPWPESFGTLDKQCHTMPMCSPTNGPTG